ncbi:Ig-like domain-containing protein, partial [Psychrobacter sp. BF1]|uniref:Ig-like domain-containing protein n=1 Tax=Psychrobacter sp. BF1 TaxID=2821147 RepID=UPI00211A97C3
MSTITVKVNNQTKTIAEHTVVTKDGVPTIIKAINKVNYELFDQSIGRAPNHIITKRVNNDLHISFEEEGIESDLIIEGFYSETDSALIGIAEDGSYYYYIPDTGEVADYVTELLAGDVEGQALGGNSQVLPWWVGASSEGFNALPWLVGLAGIGLIGAASGGSNDKQDAPKPDTTAPTAPTLDINAAGTEITGKTEPGAKVEVDTNGDGKPDYTVTADANGNFVVDTSEKPLTNGETITATATDKAGNESGPTTIVAGDTTAPTAPDKVVVGNGDAFITNDEIDKDGNVDVVVTLPTDAKEGDVVVVNGQEHPITKGDLTAGTVTVKVPAPTEGGKLDVEATIKDPAGNTSAPVTEEVTRDTTAPTAPDKVVVGNGDDFITNDEIDKDGNVDVVVTLPTDAKEGDVVVVNGQEHPITKGD